MKVIAGDFGEGRQAKVLTGGLFQRKRLRRIQVRRGWLPSLKIYPKEIASVEIVTEDNKKNWGRAIGAGAIGGLLAGPIGLAIGGIFGGRGKERLVGIELVDGRKLMATVDQRELQLLLGSR